MAASTLPAAPPTALPTDALRAEFGRLADELGRAGLRPEHRYAALGHLAAAAAEAGRPEPDREVIGHRIVRTAYALDCAGAVAPGAALAGSLARIGELLDLPALF